MSEGRAVVVDLDGVIWRGDVAIAGASDAIKRLRDSGRASPFLRTTRT